MRSSRIFRTAIARIEPGLTLAAAQGRLDALVVSLQKQSRADYPPESAWSVHLDPVGETVVRNARQSLLLLMMMGAVGLVLLIGCVNSERTRDIGIRIAPGTQKKAIVHMVLSQGLAHALAGAAAGLVGALILSHLMAGLLYDVSPSDPLTFTSLTVVLVIVALAACCIPARRAMRVDPVGALREA